MPHARNAQQPRKALGIVCKQHIRALIQERCGIWIEKKRIQQDVGCKRHGVVQLLGFLVSYVPLRPRPVGLAEQILAQHAQRVIPQRIAGEGGPSFYVVCILLKPLKPRPVGG
jgi:hypothetical protein